MKAILTVFAVLSISLSALATDLPQYATCTGTVIKGGNGIKKGDKVTVIMDEKFKNDVHTVHATLLINGKAVLANHKMSGNDYVESAGTILKYSLHPRGWDGAFTGNFKKAKCDF